jgi:hypothetical protein
MSRPILKLVGILAFAVAVVYAADNLAVRLFKAPFLGVASVPPSRADGTG